MNGFYLRILLSLLNSALFTCQLGLVVWRKQTSQQIAGRQKGGGVVYGGGEVAENDRRYKSINLSEVV